MEWHHYRDTKLITEIVLMAARERGLNAQRSTDDEVRAYCTDDDWLSLLVSVARKLGDSLS